jgi:glycosyltransferase involved in cell wall biosynthesis
MEINQKIAFVVYDYNIGTSPSIIHAIEMLVEHGYPVDLYSQTSRWWDGFPQIDHVNFQAQRVGSSESYQKDTDSLANKQYRVSKLIWRRILKRIFNALPSYIIFLYHLSSYILWLWRNTKPQNYICLIGIEREGLVAAIVMGILRKIPVLYYSMELHLISQAKTGQEKLSKWLEVIANHFSVITIIQDSERETVLRRENKLHRQRILHVPVSTRGAPREEKKTAIQQQFPQVSGKRVLIHIGGIAEWNMSKELVEAASLWPDDFILILHGISRGDLYLQEIRQIADPQRVIISTNILPWKELDDWLSSADIGLVLYRSDLGPNFDLTGMSSGKLAQYLQHGLPIITTSQSSLKQVVADFHCGQAINEMRDIKDISKNIFDSYSTYSVNAVNCYKMKYIFDNYFSPIIQEIENLGQP